MEIIYKNLPETNDIINLIIESSILSKNQEIIYINTNENLEIKNKIILNQKQYKFNSIFKDLEKEKFSEIITKNIIIKNNLTLLLMLNNHNENSLNYNEEISNIFNKDNIPKLNVKNIIYNYYTVNLNENKNDNIIKDKILKEENNYIIEIPKDKNKINLSLLKIKIDYSDINISSILQILFIYNSYEKIIPLFTIEQNENEVIALKEKFKNLLSIEKDIKDKINNLTVINSDYLENICMYKNEVMNYYNNFLKNLEKLEKKENNVKNVKDENIVSDLLKEAKNVLNTINNEQFKEREKEIYQKYIQIYSNTNNPKTEKNSYNNYHNEELKIIINKFNNLNEELIEMLENEKNNNKDKKEDKEKDIQIEELKNKVELLEKELNEEKIKSSEIKNKQNDINLKQRSLSEAKAGTPKDNQSQNKNNNTIRLEEENRNLKKKIEELKEVIFKLKLSNESLFKTNEKLIKEKNNIKNELIREKTSNSSIVVNNSIDNVINNEIYNSTNKNMNKNQFNTNSKSKKLNKNKTNMEPLFTGHSLLLLKKINDENKELAKQLKDFSSKNLQLELSLKGINNGESNNSLKSQMSSSSMLSNFTNNRRNELKNIEKKYGLIKK